MTSVVTARRVSRDVATLEDVEAAACDTERVLDALLSSRGVEEAFVLQTCHRVEVYVVSDDEATGRRAAESALDVDAGATTGHEASLRHLLRVAAGLESMVLGEDQVLGQVRTARSTAAAAGAIGPVLGEAVTKALHVGERARTETAINEGVVSLGSAAVEVVDRRIDLEGGTALVVGAGEMGSLAAKAFADTPVASVAVANRTPERARHLASEIQAEARGVPLAAAPVDAADVVVTATGADEPVFGVDDLADAGETLIVDLGQPRDVARGADALDGVEVLDADALEAVTAATRERRREAAAAVEEIVDREFDRLLAQFKRKQADQVIAGMYEGAERVKERELEEAIGRLEAAGELPPEQREVVESLADALVSQLLAAPTRSLRDAAEDDDWTTIATAIDLFDPTPDNGGEETPLDQIRGDADADREGAADAGTGADGD